MKNIILLVTGKMKNFKECDFMQLRTLKSIENPKIKD